MSSLVAFSNDLRTTRTDVSRCSRGHVDGTTKCTWVPSLSMINLMLGVHGTYS